MSDIQELAKYLRQYRHNDSSGFVFGYDKDGTDALVECLTAENEALREEVGRLSAFLSTYQSAINKIDDWFEYGNESRADRCRVHKILAELTEGLRQQAKESGND